MPGPDAPSPDQAPVDRPTEAAPSTAEPAALRDAASIAMRVSADEQRADAERERLTREALPVLPPAEAAGVDLGPDEWLHAIRRVALLERRQEAQPTGGILFLTSQRLLHVTGEGVEEVPLVKISEMAVAMERLLLIELADGSDLAIEVDQPRLLRVQVSAARAAGRGREE